MKSWILSIVTTVFIISLISLILPNGKMSKNIKQTLSLIVLIVIVTPIFNLKNLEVNFDNFFNDNNIEIQNSFVDYINFEKVGFMKEDCLKIIAQEGVSGAEIILNYNVGEDNVLIIEKATINLKNAVINSENEHINIIEKLKYSISEYLKISETMVIIYE